MLLVVRATEGGHLPLALEGVSQFILLSNEED